MSNEQEQKYTHTHQGGPETGAEVKRKPKDDFPDRDPPKEKDLSEKQDSDKK